MITRPQLVLAAAWAGANHLIPVLNHLGMAYLLCEPEGHKSDMSPLVVPQQWEHIQGLLAKWNNT